MTTPQPVTCLQAEQVYSKWLKDPDPVPTRLVLAAYAANMYLQGDPVCLMEVGGSGIGKTARIMPLAKMFGVVMVSTLTGEAALLSASPKRERAKEATGGVLRQIEKKFNGRGVLVIKDFTSILSMNREQRNHVIGALREVYDGRYDRHYGTDGGQALTWEGHCGIIAACTTAIDTAHSVTARMGPRFLFVRLASPGLDEIGDAALDQTGWEEQMNRELVNVTWNLLAAQRLPPPHELHAGVRKWLRPLANMASLARSPVERDFQGEVELIGDAEAPTRIIKQLGQLWRACGMLGLDEAHSWEAVRRAGLDSIPKLRRAVIAYLGKTGGWETTATIAQELGHPLRTTMRALEDLTGHGVTVRSGTGRGTAASWMLSDQADGWWKIVGDPA